MLVPKPDGSFRICTDYRKVNSCTKTDTFSMPRIDDFIDKIGQSKFVSKFDLLKGFWQIPLTEKAKENSAFVTPDGLFQYIVMPFRYATFHRPVNQVISGLDSVGANIDGVIFYSDTWEEHLRLIRTFFDRVSEFPLTVNLNKS